MNESYTNQTNIGNNTFGGNIMFVNYIFTLFVFITLKDKTFVLNYNNIKILSLVL